MSVGRNKTPEIMAFPDVFAYVGMRLCDVVLM